MMSIRSRRALLGIALVAVVALTGAGASLAAGDQVKAKDTLVVLEDDIAPALDYDGSSAAHPGLSEVLANTMDPLVSYPHKKVGGILEPIYNVGQLQFEPRLAQSYSKSGLTWTFKLRRNVVSCAGNRFTADDVVYTFARAKSVSGAAAVGWFMGNVGGIFSLDPIKSKDPKAKELNGEVKKIDDYTVQFKQLHENELFPRILEIFGSWIWDSKEMKAHATAKDPWSHNYAATQNGPGFGAYCLTKWVKGSEIDLAANPRFYGKKPQFTKVIMRKVPSNANRVAAIKSGSADIVTRLTPQEFANVGAASGVTVFRWNNNKGLSLGLNFNFAPWNLATNRLVRQAVAYAVPYDDIIKNDYQGQAKRWGGPCPSRYFGYKPFNVYSTNIAKAKALLAKAGFPDGKGLDKYQSGFQLYYVAERRTLLDPIVNRIKTSLAQIGMNISLQPISSAEFADRTLTKFDTPMLLRDDDRPLGSDIGYCALWGFVSTKNGGNNNESAYVSSTFDNLFFKSQTTTGAARLALLTKMQKQLMVDDLPAIPIAETPSMLAVRKGITNWEGQTYDILSFRFFTSS